MLDEKARGNWRALAGLAWVEWRATFRRDWPVQTFLGLMMGAMLLALQIDLDKGVRLAAATDGGPARGPALARIDQGKLGIGAAAGQMVWTKEAVSSATWRTIPGEGVSFGDAKEGVATLDALQGMLDGATQMARKIERRLDERAWTPRRVGVVGELPKATRERLEGAGASVESVRLEEVDAFLAGEAAGHRAGAVAIRARSQGEAGSNWLWLSRAPELDGFERRKRDAWARELAVDVGAQAVVQALSERGLSKADIKPRAAMIAVIDAAEAAREKERESARERAEADPKGKMAMLREVGFMALLFEFGVFFGATAAVVWAERAAEGSFEFCAKSARPAWSLASAAPLAVAANVASIGALAVCAAWAGSRAFEAWVVEIPTAAAATGLALIASGALMSSFYEAFAMSVSKRIAARLVLAVVGPAVAHGIFYGKAVAVAALAGRAPDLLAAAQGARGVEGALVAIPMLLGAALFWAWMLHRRVGPGRREPWQGKPDS